MADSKPTKTAAPTPNGASPPAVLDNVLIGQVTDVNSFITDDGEPMAFVTLGGGYRVTFMGATVNDFPKNGYLIAAKVRISKSGSLSSNQWAFVGFSGPDGKPVPMNGENILFDWQPAFGADREGVKPSWK